jgi:hypothetical protein
VLDFKGDKLYAGNMRKISKGGFLRCRNGRAGLRPRSRQS